MRKHLFSLLFLITIFCISCGGANSDESASSNENSSTAETTQNEQHGTEVKPGDVQLTSPLNAQWIADGKGIY